MENTKHSEFFVAQFWEDSNDSFSAERDSIEGRRAFTGRPGRSKLFRWMSRHGRKGFKAISQLLGGIDL